MDPSPWTGEWAGRNAVFVSYSRTDAEWMQAFRVMLTPILDRQGIELWVDTDIQAGDEWNLRIEQGIERSGVALLLVSKDYLASDFIMKYELPALISHRVRLAPVLVGSCLFAQMSELVGVQWLHDPRREGALNLVAEQPGERDRRISRACENLLPLLPAADASTVVRGDESLGEPLVEEVPVEAVAGDLSGVPAAPPGYVAREELTGLIAAVAAVQTGAVGLTGRVPPFGLHGQGGIGKSVLAAAVARDETTRRRFPDGVYWVTVGEAGDVLGAQLELLGRIDPRSPTPRTPREAERMLGEALAGRRVLLIVDDVWSDAAAQSFRLTGGQGRVLYTSRDPQVLAAVNAKAIPVEVLSLASARALARAVLDGSGTESGGDLLPDDADVAIEQVGRVALAVALLAAAVRGGRTWGQVATDLIRDADVFGDHPYANTFKAMQVGVAALPDDLTEALVGLVVLPRDSRSPVAAVARYWAHTRGHTAAQTATDLDRLALANVLTLNRAAAVDGDDTSSIEFHDLQHDYLLLHAPALAGLHAQMLDAYRALVPHRRLWSRLPAREPYIWDHLITHLRHAGARRELAATATDPLFVGQRIAAKGVLVAEHDLADAAIPLPTDRVIGWWRAWLPRHATMLTLADDIAGVEARTRALVPTLRGWLEADPTRPIDVDPAQLGVLSPSERLTISWGLTTPSSAQTRVLSGHTDGPVSMAWSMQSDHLATGGYDGTLLVRQPSTGKTVLSIDDGEAIRAIDWSPDERLLLVARHDGQIHVWNPVNGQLQQLIESDPDIVCVATTWTAAGGTVAVASTNRKIHLWDLSSGRKLATLPGRPYPCSALAWAPRDSQAENLLTRPGVALAAGYTDGWVQLWHTLTATRMRHALHSSSVATVAWSPDGKRLVVAGHSGMIGEVDFKHGSRRTLPTSIDHPGPVRTMAWSEDGKWLATAGDDRQVRLWDPAARTAISTALVGHTRPVNAVAWSPDSTCLATASIDGQVRIWDPTVAARDSYGRNNAPTYTVAWSPDGRHIATAGETALQLWDPTTGHTVGAFEDPTRAQGIVQAAAWSPDGEFLAVAGASPVVLVWQLDTGRVVKRLTEHTDWVRVVAWSPDGSRLATAGTLGQIRLWDVAAAQSTLLADLHSAVYSLAWSRDGSSLTAAGEDGRIRAWSPMDETASTGRRHWFFHREPEPRVIGRHPAPISVIRWSPDNTCLASGGADGVLRLWHPGSAVEQVASTGDPRAIHSLAWSPDSAHLALCRSDGEIVITGVRSRVEPIRFRLGSASCIDWFDDHIAAAESNSVVLLHVENGQRQVGAP